MQLESLHRIQCVEVSVNCVAAVSQIEIRCVQKSGIVVSTFINLFVVSLVVAVILIIIGINFANIYLHFGI